VSVQNLHEAIWRVRKDASISIADPQLNRHLDPAVTAQASGKG
jgi:hypothetical protein